MADTVLKHPWVFTVVVVVVWVLVWIGIEVFLFNDDLPGAVITGTVSGLVFALFYLLFSRYTE